MAQQVLTVGEENPLRTIGVMAEYAMAVATLKILECKLHVSSILFVRVHTVMSFTHGFLWLSCFPPNIWIILSLFVFLEVPFVINNPNQLCWCSLVSFCMYMWRNDYAVLYQFLFVQM